MIEKKNSKKKTFFNTSSPYLNPLKTEKKQNSVLYLMQLIVS